MLQFLTYFFIFPLHFFILPLFSLTSHSILFFHFLSPLFHYNYFSIYFLCSSLYFSPTFSPTPLSHCDFCLLSLKCLSTFSPLFHFLSTFTLHSPDFSNIISPHLITLCSLYFLSPLFHFTFSSRFLYTISVLSLLSLSCLLDFFLEFQSTYSTIFLLLFHSIFLLFLHSTLHPFSHFTFSLGFLSQCCHFLDSILIYM